jgi:hypothetical protein
LDELGWDYEDWSIFGFLAVWSHGQLFRIGRQGCNSLIQQNEVDFFDRPILLIGQIPE